MNASNLPTPVHKSIKPRLPTFDKDDASIKTQCEQIADKLYLNNNLKSNIKNTFLTVDYENSLVNDKSDCNLYNLKLFAQNFKTEECRNFKKAGYCPYFSKCKFAHGEHELKRKIMSVNYKTVLCRNFLKNGWCRFGNKCLFIHEPES